jgi:hypothetical protein
VLSLPDICHGISVEYVTSAVLIITTTTTNAQEVFSPSDIDQEKWRARNEIERRKWYTALTYNVQGYSSFYCGIFVLYGPFRGSHALDQSFRSVFPRIRYFLVTCSTELPSQKVNSKYNFPVQEARSISAGFEVLKVVVMKVPVFWHIAPCSPYMDRRFGGTYHLRLQVSSYAPASALVYCSTDFRPWRWSWFFPPKRHFIRTTRRYIPEVGNFQIGHGPRQQSRFCFRAPPGTISIFILPRCLLVFLNGASSSAIGVAWLQGTAPILGSDSEGYHPVNLSIAYSSLSTIVEGSDQMSRGSRIGCRGYFGYCCYWVSCYLHLLLCLLSWL